MLWYLAYLQNILISFAGRSEKLNLLIIQLVSYIKLIGNYFNFIEDYRINIRKITSIYKQELKLFEHGSKRVQGNKITERFLV
jgi:hypothetical protein